MKKVKNSSLRIGSRLFRLSVMLLPIIILACAYVAYSIFTNPSQELKLTKFERNKDKIDNEQLMQFLPLLPEDSPHFFIRHYGFSPNKSRYAFLAAPTPNYVKDYDKYRDTVIGLWIVDVPKVKAELLRLKCNYTSGVFSKWIADNKIELINWGTLTYEVEVDTCRRTSETLVNIELTLPRTPWEYPIEFISNTGSNNCNLKLQKSESNAPVNYPFSCIKESDIRVNAKGYSSILIEYVSDNSIKVNGVLYNNLVEKKGWITIN